MRPYPRPGTGELPPSPGRKPSPHPIPITPLADEDFAARWREIRDAFSRPPAGRRRRQPWWLPWIKWLATTAGVAALSFLAGVGAVTVYLIAAL